MRRFWLMAGLLPALAAGAGDKAPATWREPLSRMEFVQIPKGCFQMGNRKAVVFREEFPGLPLSYLDTPFNDELPQHEVCVDGFWMGRYEVRADEWHRVMGGQAKRPEAPMANVSWQQANAFAAKLSERTGGKYRFRLPTEAEWEYACRAGASSEIVAKRGELADRALYVVEPDGIKSQTQAVGQLAANAFGLHDMLGNVWEWVQDSYVSNGYMRHGLYNPRVQTPGPERVIRGASFRSEPLNVRCAKRSYFDAALGRATIGLRLVRIP